jgi:hypothetical protein
MIMRLSKEVCEPSLPPVSIGKPILECEACHCAIHTKCHKSAGFSYSNGSWVCNSCAFSITPRYNPFAELLSNDSEKSYEDECAGEGEALQKMSDVLNKCERYKTCD